MGKQAPAMTPWGGLAVGWQSRTRAVSLDTLCFQGLLQGSQARRASGVVANPLASRTSQPAVSANGPPLTSMP